ncbi:MAG: PAS domain S-box protein [Bryobacterales bacterium]|nr:PAS domain S-box protein [Bryobacterales bacterium]
MTELRGQLVSALLVVVTVAAVICAAINYQQQRLFRLPDDGVVWMQAEPGGKTPVVEAAHIAEDSPAARAGIKAGDVVKSIGVLPVGSATYQGVPIEKAEDVAAVLSSIGAFRDAQYVLERDGVQFSAKVILGEVARDAALYSQYAVGLAYLSIGIFLYFRRSRAPMSLHFYLLCLVSFILHTFHYTGKLNGFDTAIYAGNVVAGFLAPALFLHFCLAFPQPLKRRLPVTALSVYLAALTLMGLQLGVATGVVRTAVPLIELRWLIDRGWLLLFALCYLGGGVLLHLKCVAEDDPIVRKQLKWLRNGTLAAFVPFTILYAAPYALGVVPGTTARLAVLFLGFLPLTWAYAILRYRLMDVDVIFQQGYVYVLATLGVMGVVYALVYALAKRDELSPAAVVLLVLVAVFIFQPLRNWTQELLDRYVFYKDQYDYRRTLIDFARELSSEMDLDRTFTAVGERLIRTLSLAHVAFFLESGRNAGEVELRVAVAKDGRQPGFGEDLDLSFLKLSDHMPYLFFERTRHAFDIVSREAPASVRATIARLDLTYYLPCVFRGRTVAWLGVSRTAKGDFLASDDLELLMTLSNYVAMAVENARLYRSLADKAAQYERLKEFSENIVESINVGILAADLDDRVESWNSQIERLTGIPRVSAVGRTLSELFPSEWQVHFARGDEGGRVRQMYKVPLHSFPDAGGAASVRLVNVAITPLVTKDGEQIGRLIIFDDVTEREDLQRRLVQADKLSSIGLLAAGVAHEVNTPLAVISTYAQMLAKQVNGDDQKAKLLDKIAKQTFRASEIVNSLLNFSRTSSASDFDDVDLNKVVRETATLLEHQLRKAGIEVVLDLDATLPAIRGNFGRLQQVFLNLFLNARDAMESGGTLTVASSTEKGNPRIEVRDTGAGIPAEMVNRIFDPFFTTKTAKKGTGLGLSITYGIVEEHGGSIEAAPAGGPGAVFRLEFPAVQKAVNA